MKTLRFLIRDKHITRQDGNAVVAGAVNHYELNISFDDDWDGLTKTVVLENGDVKVELLYTGGLTLPWEVCREGGLLLSVRGTKTLGDGRTQVVRTARMAKPIPVEPGGSEEGEAPSGFTPELAASVRQREDDTDKYEDTLGTYLVHLATQPMNDQDSVESSKLLHLIGDFERIADHAVNIIESAEELKEKGVSFTDSAKKELQTMLNAVSEIVDLTSRAFLQDDLTLARQVEPLEQVIDKLKDELRTNHIARLQRGECSLAAGFVLSDLLTNLERVADHCSNIAGCLLDMKNERIDLHKYLGDVKSGSNEFLMQYNTFEEKYKLA